MSQDGFGTRTLSLDPDSGDPIEVLTLAPALARVPEFVDAVGERVARLARVRHTMYARVRQLDRSSADVVKLSSDHVAGWRLAHVLEVVERERLTLDISAVITLLRQLIPAVALFSRHQREATIGTIGPERLLLTPQGRLVVAEYVLAPGLEKLQLPRERLWREFRVAVPFDATTSRIPPSADVIGVGVTAMSLLLGRRLKDDEYLVSLGDLFEVLTEASASATKKLSEELCTWVARALQFEPETAFQSTQEAQVAFEETLAREKSHVMSPVQLDRFITAFEKIAGAPRVPTPVRHEPPHVAGAPTRRHHPVAHGDVPVRQTDESLVATLTAISSGTPPAPRDTPIAPPAPIAASPEPLPVKRALVSTQAPSPSPAVVPSVSEEAEIPAVDPALLATAPPPAWRRYALPGLAVIVIIQAGVIAWLARGVGAAPLGAGEISIQSRPVAARVTIDGEERGLTPFQSEITPGSHVVEVRVGRSEPRVIPVMIRAGVQTGLYVELQSVATSGGLEVRTEPAKAKVTIGGQYRGETPLVLKDLPPGEIDVLIQSGGREVRQTVRIEPGITSQLVVPLGR